MGPFQLSQGRDLPILPVLCVTIGVAAQAQQKDDHFQLSYLLLSPFFTDLKSGKGCNFLSAVRPQQVPQKY